MRISDFVNKGLIIEITLEDGELLSGTLVDDSQEFVLIELSRANRMFVNKRFIVKMELFEIGRYKKPEVVTSAIEVKSTKKLK